MSEHFSHYTIIEPIGAGGMGEVYRARDTQLDRDVALKILPEAFTADPERLARFEREAKLLASLNHPNIGAIYAIAREGSRIGLALELVEGEDLAALIARGPVPTADTLDIALQVSLALEYAHDQGVIHRDLKPANIKITPDGTIKVLDFGLAKAVDTTRSDVSNPGITQSPTMMGTSTQAGMIMGTAAYMSPEQARGKPLDRRTDIFSFGIVVFEMLTGSRPFDGETISDTLASILAREADLSKLPANTPPALRLIVERCLEKDAKRRMRDIGEARLIIEAVRGGDNTASAILGAAPDDGAPLQKESKHRPREIIAWAVAITAAAMAAFFATRPGQAPPPTTASLLSVPIDGGNDVRFSYNGLALSPDGARVAYANNGKLYIRALDAWDPIEISNSEGASTPFWSPDGKWLAFAIEKTIWKVRPDGTQRTRVGEAEEDFTRTTGGAWMANGQLVFRGQRDLFAMPASGGDAAMFVSGEDTALVDFHQPEALPGGAGIIVVVHTQAGVNSIGLVSPDGTLEIVAKIDGGELGDPVYSPSGHILYTIKGDLWALPFDLGARKVTGEPVVVARNAAVPSISADGPLTVRWHLSEVSVGHSGNSYSSIERDRS